MKRFGDFLLNTPAAAAAAGVLVISLVLFLIPPLHSAAWVIGIVTVLLVAVCLLFIGVKWWQDQQRIDRLNAEIADASKTYASVGLSPIEEDEHEAADTTRAKRVLELFPKDAGLVQYMRLANGFSTLDPQLMDPLRTFLDEFKKTSFEQQSMHAAFMDVYRAGKSFDSWVSEETYIPDSALEIKPGDIREGGWHEFSAARDAGEQNMDAFLDSLRVFERTALETRTV